MVAPEKLAMKACSKSLIDTLAVDDIESLADDLHSNNLLAKNVHEGLELATKTGKQKARDVVNNVAGKVNAKPKPNFVNFTKILVENGQSDLAKMLEEKYVQEGGDRSSLRPEAQSTGAEGAVGSSGTAVQGASGSSKTDSSQVSIQTLRLLEHTSADGSVEKLNILQEVCPRWKDIGMLVGLTPSQLIAIEKQRQLNQLECCIDVFYDWLGGKGTEKYPLTWQGLSVLLTDIECSEVAETLKGFNLL